MKLKLIRELSESRMFRQLADKHGWAEFFVNESLKLEGSNLDTIQLGSYAVAQWEKTKDPKFAVVGAFIQITYAKPDIKESIKLLEQATEAGLIDANFLLAMIYIAGEDFGIEKDYHRAFDLLSNASARGSVQAMKLLGQLHSKEDTPFHDYKKAKEQFYLGYKAGDSECALSLARMYERGDGVLKDYAKYIQLATESAQLGDSSAMIVLASEYKYGNLVIQDLVKSYMYYNILCVEAPYNDYFKQQRDSLELKMTFAQVRKAQELSSEFLNSGNFLELKKENEKIAGMFKKILGSSDLNN